MIYKKDSLTSCLWEGTLYDMLKSAIRGHWDKIILDKSRATSGSGIFGMKEMANHTISR